MAESKLSPLQSNVPIVNDDGTPNDYFIQWMQQLRDEKAAIEEDVALTAGLDIIAGFGMNGGGPLDGSLGDITLAADVQEILDSISNAQGSVLYRGAAAWSALGPGAAGDFLKTNGPGANPAWAAPPGGGGGGAAWVQRAFWDFAVHGAVGQVDSGALAGYTDVLMIMRAVTTSVATWRCFRCSTDGGVTYDNAARYLSIDTPGSLNASDTEGYFHSTSSAAARYSAVLMYGIQLNGPVKPYYGPRGSDDISMYDNTPPVTNIRIFPIAGGSTFTGGKIWILAR